MIQTQVQVDFNEIHRISVKLLTLLEQQGITYGIGAAACALTLGRCLDTQSPTPPEKEAEWVGACMEWAGTYWAATTGSVN